MIRTEPDGARSDSLSSSPTNNATVAELVDAQDLGSCGATRGGSSPSGRIAGHGSFRNSRSITACSCLRKRSSPRSEEHTSELQSQSNLVCRLLLDKKKYNICANHLVVARVSDSC